jgi:hypothetical protein
MAPCKFSDKLKKAIEAIDFFPLLIIRFLFIIESIYADQWMVVKKIFYIFKKKSSTRIAITYNLVLKSFDGFGIFVKVQEGHAMAGLIGSGRKTEVIIRLFNKKGKKLFGVPFILVFSDRFLLCLPFTVRYFTQCISDIHCGRA